MKKLLLILSVLLSTNSFSQISDVSGVYVNVYMIPFDQDPFVSPDLTPDYVRVHSETKVTINLENVINELYKKMEATKKEVLYSSPMCDFNKCRVVIDLVKGNDIYYSMAISSSYDFFIQNSLRNRMVNVYKGDLDFVCYLKTLFPYFIEYSDYLHCK